MTQGAGADAKSLRRFVQAGQISRLMELSAMHPSPTVRGSLRKFLDGATAEGVA